MSTDLLLEVREVLPNGNIGEIMSDYRDLGFQDLPSEPGVVRFTYPRDGRNAGLIGHDREYCLYANGNKIASSHFVIKQSRKAEVGADQDMVEWSGRTLLARLEEALIGPVQNRPGSNTLTPSEAAAYRDLAEEWAAKQREKNRADMKYDRKHGKDPVQDLSRRGDANRDGTVNWLDYKPSEEWSNKLETAPPPASPQWKNQTPGKIMLDIIRAAQARGMITNMSVGFTAYSDSAGRPWTYRVTTAFEIGQNAMFALNWLKERGVAEGTTNGRKIMLYNPNRGVDRSKEVTLAEGTNLEDSPFERDTSQMVNAVFVESDTGVHGWVASTASIKAYGRREGYLKVEKIKTWRECEALGRAYLNRSDDAPAVYTYGIVPGYGIDPFYDFNVGDVVGCMIDGDFYRQRITGVSVDVDEQGDVKVAATAGGRVRLRTVAAVAASMAGITSWTPNVTTYSTGVPRTSVEVGDGEAPWQPSLPVVTSRAGTLRVAWDGLDADGDEPVFDQAFVEVHAYDGPDDDFEPSKDTIVDTISQVGVTMLNAQSYSVDTKIKLVAVDKGGDKSPPSEPVLIAPKPVLTEDIAQDAVTFDQIAPEAIKLENLAPEVDEKIEAAASGSDGLAPGNQPTNIRAAGGIRAITVAWTAAVNPDPLTYDVWIGLTDSFIPDYTNKTNLAGSVAGTSMNLRTMPNGAALDPATVYYVTVTCRDADGKSTAIHPALTAVSPTLIMTPDIAADQAWLGSLDVGRLTSGEMQADVTISGKFQTASSGQRSELDTDGFRHIRADGSPGMNLPNEGSPSFYGDAQLEKATLTQGVEIQGTESFVAKGASITLQSGVSNPTDKPVAMGASFVAPTNGFVPPVSGQPQFRRCLDVTNWAGRAVVANFYDGTPRAKVEYQRLNLSTGAVNGTYSIDADSPTYLYDTDTLDMAVVRHGGTDPNYTHNIVFLGYDSSNGWVTRTTTEDAFFADGGKNTVARLIGPKSGYPANRYFVVGEWALDQHYVIYKRSDNKLHINIYDTPTGSILYNWVLTTGTYSQAVLKSTFIYTHEPESGGATEVYICVAGKFAGPNSETSVRMYTYNPDLNPVGEVTAMETFMGSGVDHVKYFGGYGPITGYGDSGIVGLINNGQQVRTYAKNIGFKHWYKFAQAYYDSDATNQTHETQMSPTTDYQMENGKYIYLSSVAVPADNGEPDDVNAVRFYAARRSAGVNPTAPSKYQRLSTQATSQTTKNPVVYSNKYLLPAVGADADTPLQPKATNEFLSAQASPATFRSADGSIALYGDGTTELLKLKDHMAVMRYNANSPVPNNAWTTMAAWTLDELVGMTYASGLLTVSRAGVYQLIGVVAFATNNTGSRGIYPLINGAVGPTTLMTASQQFQSTIPVAAEVRLNAGETIGLRAFQNSGGVINVNGDATGQFTRVVVRRVRL